MSERRADLGEQEMAGTASAKDTNVAADRPNQWWSDETSDANMSAPDTAQQAADTAKQKGEEVAQTAKQKTSQLTDQAQQKADQGMDKAASGLGQAADTIRQQGSQMGGGASTVANTAANTLDSASQYLREKNTDELLDDLEALVRRKPVQSVLVAAGIGFVLSKLFS